MNPENERRLYERFPRLYRGRHLGINRNRLALGIQCGDGWLDTLMRLSEKLEKECDRLQTEEGEKPNDLPIVNVVKEKMGGLTVYMQNVKNYHGALSRALEEAWTESLVTCECCAKPGRLRTDGYHRVRCDPCEARLAVERHR